jgi:hypothetical protein
MSETTTPPASGTPEQPAHATTAGASGASGRVPKTPQNRRFFSFQYGVDVLHDEGIFKDLKECREKTGIAVPGGNREHEWVLVETEVNRWIKLVRSHPEATAFFALDYDVGTLIYWGDFPNYEAAVANRAEKDPQELRYEILRTDVLRTWKTPSSEGEKIKIIPD